MNRPLRLARRAGLVAAVAFVLPAVGVARGDDVDEQTAARAVEAVLSKAPQDDVPTLWSLGKALAKDGKAAIPALRKVSETAAPGPRLAVGRALVLLEDETKGAQVLQAVAADPKGTVGVRIAALKLLEKAGEEEQGEWLARAIDESYDPALKMAMAKALWEIGSSADKGKARGIMLEYLKSEDRARREEGALALGEIGAAAEARPALIEMRDEPTERGRSAAFLLDLLAREAIAERVPVGAGTPPAPGPTPGPAPVPAGPSAVPQPPNAQPPGSWPLLDEIRGILEQAYVDPTLVDRRKQEDAAAEGISKGLDPFTEYLSPEDNARLLEGLDPTYGGVGAYVQNDPDNGLRFTVSRPIWGGPLYKAGMRAGDVILRIDGTDTTGLAVDECVRILKGPAGTKVVLSVFRPGWTEPQDFTLTRANITIPTTAYDVLPGGIGFLEILSFGEETAREVHAILDGFEQEGVSSLVLDLRANPGGYLQAAVDIASEFLPEGTLVVSEKGRAGVWEEKRHLAKNTGKGRPAWPVVVLVNGGTASAAEILSGALKVHGRARLVGGQTYGKGSVQLPLTLTTRPGEPFQDLRRNGRYDAAEKFTDGNGDGIWEPGETFVDANRNGRYDAAERYEDVNKNGKWDPGASFKITIARYLLPDGTNLKIKYDVVKGKVVRSGGIAPHLEVKDTSLDLWERQAQAELYKKGSVRKYVDEVLAGDKTLVAALARTDRHDPGVYPGFDAWYEGLGTKLSKQAVRQLVRIRVRDVVSDAAGRALVGDVVDDEILRAALVDLFATRKADPRSVPDLAFLADLPPPAKPDDEAKEPDAPKAPEIPKTPEPK